MASASKRETVRAEELPFRFVHYPPSRGTFIAFAESSQATPVFCACMLRGLANALAFALQSGDTKLWKREIPSVLARTSASSWKYHGYYVQLAALESGVELRSLACTAACPRAVRRGIEKWRDARPRKRERQLSYMDAVRSHPTTGMQNGVYVVTMSAEEFFDFQNSYKPITSPHISSRIAEQVRDAVSKP